MKLLKSSCINNKSKENRGFSSEGFGTVTRVYIVCKEDNVMVEEFQCWMIQNNPPNENVKEKKKHREFKK